MKVSCSRFLQWLTFRWGKEPMTSVVHQRKAKYARWWLVFPQLQEYPENQTSRRTSWVVFTAIWPKMMQEGLVTWLWPTYENDRDESCTIRSESVPNSPNGELNVKVPLRPYQSSHCACGGQWMGMDESASSFWYVWYLHSWFLRLYFLGVYSGTWVLQPEAEIKTCAGKWT